MQGQRSKHPGTPVTGQQSPISSYTYSYTWMLKALVNGIGQDWGRQPLATERSFLCLRTKLFSLKKKGLWGGEDAEVVDELLVLSRDCSYPLSS